MDQIRLKQYAEQLNLLLIKYSVHNKDAVNLHVALAQLIRSAQSKSIAGPMKWNTVPGDWFFTEGTLGAYSDLESAYSRFKIEVTGGESEVLRELRRKIEGNE